MLQRLAIAKILPLTVISAALVACGGGGGGNSADSGNSNQSAVDATAEGLWLGSTNRGSEISGVVLDDGTYYVIYSMPNDPSVIGGFVHGSSTTTAGGEYSSDDARDFYLPYSAPLTATVSATVSTGVSFNGTINYMQGDVVLSTGTYTSTYDDDYEQTPALSTIAGTYDGSVGFLGGGEFASINIASDGSIIGSGDSGCAVSGTINPRAQGNVYNIFVTFGAAPCFFENMTLEGVAYYDSTNNGLVAALTLSDKSNGMLFVGVKQ